MKKEYHYDCTVADLRQALMYIKGDRKLIVNGLNDVIIIIHDNKDIELRDHEDSNMSKSVEEKAPEESKADEEERTEIIDQCSYWAERRKAIREAHKDDPVVSIGNSFNKKKFLEDFYQFIIEHRCTCFDACRILISNKTWRKRIKRALRIRKAMKKFAKNNTGTPSIPISVSKLDFMQRALKPNNPQVPLVSGLARVVIPYLGYIITQKDDYVHNNYRFQFLDECKAYYEANGCTILSCDFDAEKVVLNVTRTSDVRSSKDLMDFYANED